MIIQFAFREYSDIESAEFLYWLCERERSFIEQHSDNLNEIASNYGIPVESLQNNTKFLGILDEVKSRRIKTPHDDWNLVPFIIRGDETPFTVVNSWIRNINRRGSPKTTRTYAYALFDFLQYLEANNVEWIDVDDDTLASYRITMETTNSFHKRAQNGNSKISKSTIQQRLLTVNIFYKFASANGFLEQNPLTQETVHYSSPRDSNFLAHLRSYKERDIPVAAYKHNPKSKPFKFESHEHVREWINSIKDERNKLIANILYQTGMRREEIIVLKVDEIPPRSASKKGNEFNSVEFEIIGKGRKTRVISLSPATFLRLRDYIEVKRNHILEKYKRNQPDHGYVWVAHRTGNPLQTTSLNHIFRKISEKCDLKINPHTLRHSFAMEKRKDLYEDNIPNPEKILKEILGHQNITTTMTIYGHISPQELAKEADANADLIRKLSQD